MQHQHQQQNLTADAFNGPHSRPATGNAHFQQQKNSHVGGGDVGVTRNAPHGKGGGKQPQQQHIGAWNKKPNVEASTGGGAVKKKNGGGGPKKRVTTDWQKDSGLADENESKIDISKAYQGCLNKYNHLFPNDTFCETLPSNCGKVGSSCSIYVTEISSPNLFLGIENNKSLKQSFQSLKKQLEQCVEDSAKLKSTRSVTLNSFVCVNDPAEGFSRGFVVSIVEQMCDVYLIDWGYVNTYQIADAVLLTHSAIGFCRPLARLFEIAGSPTDIPFPEGFTLPVLFHVKVMMVQSNKTDAVVVKVKFKGRDLIDYYYEPGLLKKQAEESANQKSVDWSPKSTQGDESSSATNSVVEEWLINTADEEFSHFDEGPPSPTDDEALATLMEQFDLGDSVSAVVHHNQSQPHLNAAASNFGTHRVNYASNFASHPTPSNNQNQRPPTEIHHGDTPGTSQGQGLSNTVSISSRLNIKAGSMVQILISYVVLPTFFNFIPINQTTNKFREQLKTILNNVVTNPSRKTLLPDPLTGVLAVSQGQFFVAKVRGEIRRVTVKQGHNTLEKNKLVKLQDVDYGGEFVAKCNEVFTIPPENAELLKNIPVLRCNGSMSGLHPNSPSRRWTPEQCQSFRQLTENNILDAMVARVTLSPQMSVPYFNFDLYFPNRNSISVADVMRAFEYAA